MSLCISGNILIFLRFPPSIKTPFFSASTHSSTRGGDIDGARRARVGRVFDTLDFLSAGEGALQNQPGSHTSVGANSHGQARPGPSRASHAAGGRQPSIHISERSSLSLLFLSLLLLPTLYLLTPHFLLKPPSLHRGRSLKLFYFILFIFELFFGSYLRCLLLQTFFVFCCVALSFVYLSLPRTC